MYVLGCFLFEIFPKQQEVIDVSGVKLDDESKRALLDAVVVPEGWVSSAERMVVCHGSFQKPKQMDHRSVVPDLLNEIATLRPGSTASLRVVTVARGGWADMFINV